MSISSFSPWPSFTKEEADAVSEVLLSNKVNYWTGNQGRQFEKEFADFVGVNHAIAVSNGTVALDLALKGIGVSVGDEVIVTSRTFLASVSSIVTAGAVPVFADVDLDSQNITAETIRPVITSKTKAIICVHLAGWPCDMDPIMDLAAENNIKVIEDCAQAHGAKYKGRSVGSIGHVGCWSFCQDKIMTTGGEGGMVTTNDRVLWSLMWSYKDHGKSWKAIYEQQHPPGFRWLHESFGTNWRLTEMQSAIGRIQLSKLSEWQKSRFNNAKKIWNCAQKNKHLRVPVFNLKIDSESTQPTLHAAYKCYVFVNGSESDRDSIMQNIVSMGIPCFSGSCSEVYLEKAFDGTGFRPEKRLGNARKLGETSLMFLCHPTVAPDEIEKTCKALDEAVNAHFSC
ncbi:DegT/DnrJ/EryC1/StrS family aminotransferase [Neptuniibacter sp. SY11_33]|uniref:DegT/DnrJ/EryC1/StrS family aminotransferase n=1 Tax=Neptuniibacter sp. SY11_33 TaxID=3398215 RepID=UPI0039F62BEE